MEGDEDAVVDYDVTWIASGRLCDQVEISTRRLATQS